MRNHPNFLRLQALRASMQEAQIDACIIPSADPHQSEYVSIFYQARQWLTGFTGSAGFAVVTQNAAHLWTDSRYFLQALEELKDTGFELMKQGGGVRYPHLEWLCDNLKAGQTVAIDGRVHSRDEVDQYQKRLEKCKLKLVTENDPVATVWEDRPRAGSAPVYEHSINFAGISRADKLSNLRRRLDERDCSACLISALDEIAWLFNLRGSDVDFNPVFYAYAIVTGNRAYLFTENSRVPNEVQQTLKQDGVRLRPYEDIEEFVQDLRPEKALFYDTQGVSDRLSRHLDNLETKTGKSLVAAMKARKSASELDHIRSTMEKDGVALLRLFRWLEETLEKEENVTEADVAQELAGFRAEQAHYKGESFPAIVGYQANGAIVHYRPVEGNSATIKAEGILLLDSGGQYLDGTTDVTRTIALGLPTPDQVRNFTLVLKGHIALAQTKFPAGTAGFHLDTLARQYLWRHGLNYGHGTGHGVGYFLNVHEGPMGIFGRSKGPSTVPLESGMILSNEPGYYKDHEYGIRIENLVVVKSAGLDHAPDFLEFEDLTLFPMDQSLIDRGLLNRDEMGWLEKYHQMVFDRLSPHLDDEERDWLAEQCSVWSK